MSNIFEEDLEKYEPTYVWPNEWFGFRLYYESPNLRVFLLENISHNWNWLKKYSHRFRDTDHFIISLGWHFDEFHVQESDHILTILNLRKDHFHIMFNDFADKALFEKYGFQGDIINQNCFLDENKFNVLSAKEIYSATYTARMVPFKRHYLAAKVPNLALISGPAHGGSGYKEEVDVPPHIYRNKIFLTPDQIMVKLAESRVGLILSETEGACYSSSEYLLCGLPVVSTISKGGRSIWYNSSNSIICDSNPESVAEAVKEIASLNLNRFEIRDMHLNQAKYFRGNFIKMHQNLIDQSRDDVDASHYFLENFQNKLFTSISPDFESLFPE